MDLVFNNAQQFNVEDSAIYKESVRLQNLAHMKKDEFVSASSQVMCFAREGGMGVGERLLGIIHARCDAQINVQNGRSQSATFLSIIYILMF